MDQTEYHKLKNCESFYWWFRGRAKILEAMLSFYLEKQVRHKILDVGCGTGGNADLLRSFGQTTGIDISPEAARAAAEHYSQVLIGDILTAELTETFDVIMLLDVLEHIKDDRAALMKLFTLTRENGYLIITVPAYQFLWSDHDILLHHKRRYRASELTRVVQAAGFQVVKTSYFVTLLFPLIVIVRALGAMLKLIRQTRVHDPYLILPTPVNTFLTHIFGLERLWLTHASLPFGSSILCVARKPKKN